MHFEFETLLKDAFAKLALPEPKSCPSFVVADCPPRVDEIIGANLAFMVAKEINHSPTAHEHVDAEHLARLIVSAANELGGERWFSFAFGQKGFINGVPTEIFQQSFFDELCETKGSCLFSLESFVVHSNRRSENKAVPMPKFRSERALSRLKDRGADILDFAERVLGSASIDLDSGLMVLAALADPELELLAFENNLFSRHNVPWYLGHFQKATFGFTSALSKDGTSSVVGIPQNIESIAEKFFADTLEHFMRFRSSLATAVSEEAPECVLGALLVLVQTFFTFYNHPACRALMISPCSASEALIGRLSRTTGLLSKVVETGLRHVEVSLRG